MSINFIYNFQLKLHNVLSQDKKIKELVKEIYLSTMQDGKYPFISISLTQIIDQSNNIQKIYEVDFEINIFARDNNKKILLLISDAVEIVINAEQIKFGDYSVIGVKLNDLTFGEARDLIHNKLTMRYKSILKKESL